MAKCYQCGKKIGWFQKKNRRGNRGYIFDCPYCGAESTESFITNIGYIVVLLLPVVWMVTNYKEDLPRLLQLFVIWGLVYLPLSRLFWWNFFSKLTKPIIFRMFG
ncbi:MAG: hypothetical protein PHP69_04795 [Candidatus Omnitrophica bacterium]|jgi:hypothetical protein|nr:hypothetical protein [Candidatus Omnitrophota bacterium]MDD5080403.1 hypothetical protein [Candidatus Omnitrophota bacterium]MDD5440711.1 hypothetical protein [Candidatus Omnitrophota bacterium]